MLRNSVALVLVVHLLGKTVEAGWREDGLKARNELRAAHGASPLVLDAKVKTFERKFYYLMPSPVPLKIIFTGHKYIFDTSL